MIGVELVIFGLVSMIILLFTSPDTAALLGVVSGFIGALFLALYLSTYLMGWGQFQ